MSSTMLSSQTDEDFNKAHNKALFNEIQHFLNPDEATLISFSDIKKLLKPKNEVYKGMMIVPVNQIVGSEGRYHDFDNRFFPKSMHLKSRWWCSGGCSCRTGGCVRARDMSDGNA